MKKILLTTLFALGLSQAQVVSTLTGKIHHTSVYQSGSNTIADLDTANGILINNLRVHTTAAHGYVYADTLAVGQNAAGAWIGNNGAAMFAEGNASISLNGKITTNDTIVATKVRATTFQGGSYIGLNINVTNSVSSDTGFFNRISIDDALFINAGASNSPALASNSSGQVITATTVGTGAVVLQSYVDGSGAASCAAAYNAGTTYAANVGVSYLGSVYISNVDSNVGNAPSTSPTQWTAYAYCIDAITYILNNGVFH